MIVPSIPSARVRWTYVRVVMTYHRGTDLGFYHTFITIPEGDGRLSALTRCVHIAWGLVLAVENIYPKVPSPTWQHRTFAISFPQSYPHVGWEAQFCTARKNDLVVDTVWTPQNSNIYETDLICSEKLRLGHSHRRGDAK